MCVTSLYGKREPITGRMGAIFRRVLLRRMFLDQEFTYSVLDSCLSRQVVHDRCYDSVR